VAAAVEVSAGAVVDGAVGAPPPRPAVPPEPAPEWAAWDDERLLDLRLCELALRIEGSDLEDRIDELYRELEGRGLVFRPHFWLSDEWFCPDGVPGIAIPFYLAHPRLARLEMAQMREVEGGTREWCLKILRHETGHAIENAYRLRRRPRRRELFGRTSQPYPDAYSPRPYSKSFVRHLDAWYAQSHPDEDFAETFAVWLTPGSDWRRRYARWPALRKLEYVDKVMAQIASRPPLETSRHRTEPLSSLRKTLRAHYAQRRGHYGVDHPPSYDRDLLRLFSRAPEHARQPAAWRWLSKVRKRVRARASRWTGQRQYVVDGVLKGMLARCNELRLRLAGSEEDAEREFSVLLAVEVMNQAHSGGHRVPL
jgi:hypothetical protein